MAEQPFYPFGIIMAAHPGDALLAKACLASIKMYMPDIPVCIIADGGLDVSGWKKYYPVVKIVTKECTSNKYLRDNCFNSRLCALVSFWESPFEKFLYLDADTIVWGNILKEIDLSEAQLIHNSPHEHYTDAIYRSQYFNYQKVFAFTRYFDWKPYHYFNSGVFIAERMLLDLDELRELVMVWKKDRMILRTDVQSILNLLIFRGVSEGRYVVREANLQTVIPVVPRNELESIFRIQDGLPVVKHPTILHWAGKKPLLRHPGVFQAPVEFFRMLHLKNIHHPGRHIPRITMYAQEYQSGLSSYYHRIIRKLSRSHRLVNP
ncbi:MAG: glycosyltransferase [Chitinophagales bacterium]